MKNLDGRFMSKSDALDVLYDFREALMAEQETTMDGGFFLPDPIDKDQINKAISSLLWLDRRNKKKVEDYERKMETGRR